MSPTIDAISRKLADGQRLSFDDGMYLAEHVDLLTLGRLANRVREQKHGDLAYYTDLPNLERVKEAVKTTGKPAFLLFTGHY